MSSDFLKCVRDCVTDYTAATNDSHKQTIAARFDSLIATFVNNQSKAFGALTNGDIDHLLAAYESSKNHDALCAAFTPEIIVRAIRMPFNEHGGYYPSNAKRLARLYEAVKDNDSLRPAFTPDRVRDAAEQSLFMGWYGKTYGWVPTGYHAFDAADHYGGFLSLYAAVKEDKALRGVFTPGMVRDAATIYYNQEFLYGNSKFSGFFVRLYECVQEDENLEKAFDSYQNNRGFVFIEKDPADYFSSPIAVEWTADFLTVQSGSDRATSLPDLRQRWKIDTISYEGTQRQWRLLVETFQALAAGNPLPSVSKAVGDRARMALNAAEALKSIGIQPVVPA